MDLTKFDFKKLNATESVFCTLKADPKLLAEAKNRGFYNGYSEYNRLFSKLFFEGGKVQFKESIDPEFKANAWPYLRAFMGSFEPKHEEKEAICALIMSELLEP
jgi:hypothetical protein